MEAPGENDQHEPTDEADATGTAVLVAEQDRREPAPTFGWEENLNSASFWLGSLGGGAMELKIALMAQTPMGAMPAPNRPVTVLRFDADGWAKFQEAVASGKNPEPPKVQPVGADALAGLKGRQQADQDALRRIRR